MKKVLFLCTGNSCRSQMAEAIVNARMGGEWQAFSAGTKPAGYVHPRALDALSEIGIRHEGRSKRADEFREVDFDLVVTVCDSAAEECPVWLGKGKRAHHDFPDPAKAEGTEEEVMNIFRAVRDNIEKVILEILKEA
ncbi:arsenate reductase ArsC [Chloroflexi bacterium CFX6]|nr:arsenate reductase ArsC [Chloroflexi bacterium CFX6]